MGENRTSFSPPLQGRLNLDLNPSRAKYYPIQMERFPFGKSSTLIHGFILHLSNLNYLQLTKAKLPIIRDF